MAARASPGSARRLRPEPARVRAHQEDAGRAVSAQWARVSARRAGRRVARRSARACGARDRAGARLSRMHRRRLPGRRARAGRGLADSRVGARLERVHSGTSAQLAGRRGFCGAARQSRRVSARLRSHPHEPQPESRDVLRAFRRRMRSCARQFRFDERSRDRDVPRRDDRARRSSSRVSAVRSRASMATGWRARSCCR